MTAKADRDACSVEIIERTEQEQNELFEREARQQLGISGAEFLRRWNSGAYAGDEDPRVTDVAMLLPSAW